MIRILLIISNFIFILAMNSPNSPSSSSKQLNVNAVPFIPTSFTSLPQEQNPLSQQEHQAISPLKEATSDISGDKQKGESSGESHAVSPKFTTAQERQEMEAQAMNIVKKIEHLKTMRNEHKLPDLNNNYLALMKRIEDFVHQFEEDYGNSRTSYIGDILLWIGQIYPAIDGNRLKEDVRDCFVYLDENGGLTGLNEQSEKKNVLDELFKDISILDKLIALFDEETKDNKDETKYNMEELIVKYEETKGKENTKKALQIVKEYYEQKMDNEETKDNTYKTKENMEVLIGKYEEANGKEKTEKALQLVEEYYEQYVDTKLREVFGYLYIDVNRQGEDGSTHEMTFEQANVYLGKFSTLLFERSLQFFDAMQTLYSLFCLPNFQLFEGSSSNGALQTTISHECNPQCTYYAADSENSKLENLKPIYHEIASNVKQSDKEKDASKKSPSSPIIMHKNNPTSSASVSGHQQEKGDKSISLKGGKINEADDLAAEPNKFSLEKEPERKQRPEGSLKLEHPIKMISTKKEVPDEISFGSFNQAFGSGLAEIEHQTPAVIEHKMDQSLLVKNKQKEALTKVGKKEMVYRQLQGSSSSAKDGRESMRSDVPGTKPVSSAPLGRNDQSHQLQQATQRGEQQHRQPDSPPLERGSFSPRGKPGRSAKRRDGQAQWLQKKNSPSSSPTASSPLSAASSVPTSPSIASSHSKHPISSNKPRGSESKVVENKYDLLEEQGEESHEMEDKKMFEKEGGARSEIHQQEGNVVQSKSEKSESASRKKKGAATGGSSKVGKPKGKSQKQIEHEDWLALEKAAEENRQLEKSSKDLLKKQGKQAVVRKQSIAHPKTEAERQEMVTSITAILDKIADMNAKKKDCVESKKTKRERKLHELKNTYQDLMKLLEKFALDFGEKFGRPLNQYTYFDIILEWIGQVEPTLSTGEERVKVLIENVRECLRYLDKNGELVHLKKEGRQMTVFDNLLENISQLAGPIDKYKKTTKAKHDENADGVNAIELMKLEIYYKQHVHDELLEAIGYLCVGVKRLPFAIDQTSFCLLEFTYVLPNRAPKIRDAVNILCNLFSLPQFKFPESGSSSSDASGLPKKTEEEQALETSFYKVVEQIKYMNELKKECQELDNKPQEKEEELWQLLYGYEYLMGLLEESVLKLEDKTGRPLLSHYRDVDDIIELLTPEGGVMRYTLKSVKTVMHECLVYLDGKGDMVKLEKYPELTNFDELFKKISNLDGLLSEYEDRKNKAKDDKMVAEETLEKLEDYYEQHVHHELLHALGFLYIGVSKRGAGKFSFDQAGQCLKKFESVLPKRKKQILDAVETIRKLSHLPKFKLPAESISSSGSTEFPEDEQDMLIRVFNEIIDRTNHMNELKMKCLNDENADKRELSLRALMISYQQFMNSLEDFALKFGDKTGKPLSPFTKFDEILNIFKVKLPEMGTKVEGIKKFVLSCLLYMDMNGLMIHLKEQGREITVFGKLLNDISSIDDLINEVKEENEDAAKAIALKKLEEYYNQNVESNLYEAIGYLYIRVERNPREIDQVASCLNEFASMLPHRNSRILLSVDILRKLSKLPMFHHSESSSSSETVEERQAVIGSLIIAQINDMMKIKKKCEGFKNEDKNDEMEVELHKLKNNYQQIMKLLQDFALEFAGNNRALRPFTKFDLILKLFEVKLPDGKDGEEEIINVMRECLIYLVREGKMIYSKEKGKRLMVFDILLENILEMDGLIIEYDQKAGEAIDDKSDMEKEAALKELEDYYDQKVANDLYEAISYLYVGVTREPWKISQAISCLEEFALILPNRAVRITISVDILRKLSQLPIFQQPVSSSSSGPFEVTIPLAKLSQQIQAFAADPSGSSSSSHQTLPSHIITASEKSDSDPKSLKEITADEVTQMLLNAQIVQIENGVNQLKSINDNCTNMKLPPVVRQQECSLLVTKYKRMMQLLADLTNNFGNEHKWNRETHFEDIFEWICTTFKTREGLELPEPKIPVEILSKSMGLIYKESLPIIEQLLEYINGLNIMMADYDPGVEGSQMLFRRMETHYKVLVDPNLREVFTLQFIGMFKTKLPANQRVERIRKSVLEKGLNFLAAAIREHGTTGLWEGKFETAKQTLERYFDKFTDGLETLIRADLSGYVTRILGFKLLNVNEGDKTKTPEEKAKEKKAMDSWMLEEMVNSSLDYMATLLRQSQPSVTFVDDLVNGLKALKQLSDDGWKPSKQTIGSSSSKKDRGKAKVEMKRADEAEDQAMINRFSWEPMLKDVRKMIGHMILLSSLQQSECHANTIVDGLHVHVRVWAILYESISPIIDEWDHYYFVEKGHPKDQKSDNMQETLEFLAKDMENFLTKYGQAKRGKLVSKAFKKLAIMDEKFPKRHRNKHLRRLLAKYDPSKDADADHFKSCKQFDYLLLD